MDFKKINQADLSRAILCKPQLVNNWFTKAEPISDRMIVRMIEYYKDLNARWLITGEGEMLEGGKMMPGEEDLTEFGGILLDRLMDEKEKVGALKKEVEFLKAEIDHLRAGGAGRGQSHPKARAG
jgi:hypothetical protein